MIFQQAWLEKAMILVLFADGWNHSCANWTLSQVTSTKSKSVGGQVQDPRPSQVTLDQTTQDCNGNKVLEMMRYTLCSVNRVFDIIYSHGVFIPANEASKAASAGYALCVF